METLCIGTENDLQARNTQLLPTGIVFIDSAVDDYESLMAGVMPEFAVFLLDATRNGVEQISDILSDWSGLSSLHIVSHGTPGSVQLGTEYLSTETINAYGCDLKGWTNALVENAEILLYGCKVAQRNIGSEFISQLSQLTGTTVIASSTTVGNAALGGNWQLDSVAAVRSPAYRSPLAFSPELLQSYQGTFPSINNLNSSIVYTEDSSPITLDGDITLASGISYGDGYVRFSLASTTSADQFTLTSAANPIAAGAISVVGNDVYLGDGSVSNRIGVIDSFENGQNGKALKILFSSPLGGAGFESGSAGWDLQGQVYGDSANELNLDGLIVSLANNSDSNSTYTGGTGTVNIQTGDGFSASATVASGVGVNGSSALRLTSSGNINSTDQDPFGNFQSNGYGSIHGPYATSSTFTVTNGDSLSLSFRAVGSGDDYEVFGLLRKVDSNGNFVSNATPSTSTSSDNIILFAERGADTGGFVNITKSGLVSGDYRFVFVGGTYDGSGGLYVGSELYVDDIRLVSGTSSVNDSVVSTIARQVNYQSTSDNPPSTPRTLTIQARDALGVIGTATSALSIIPMNDAPTLGNTANTFKIMGLSSTGANAIEHEVITGDDRGGIAVTNSQVFYTGDGSTGRFSLNDLSGGASIGYQYDALVGNIATGEAYSLGNGGMPTGYGGGTITQLLGINDLTGSLTGTNINLSTSINVSGGSAIFSGYNRVVLYSGSDSKLYNIDLPSGNVTDLGAFTLPSRQGAESWATWGVAEYFDGAIHLDYIKNSQTIERVNVSNGVTETVATFSSLSDMAAFTVSPTNNRWYFHHEGGSQFRSGDETIGYADASFLIGSSSQGIADQSLTEDVPFSFQFATNTFVDIDAGDILTYTATLSDDTALPSWLSFNAATRTFSGTPTNNEVGILSIKVTATDLAGEFVGDTFDLTIANTNDAPTLANAISDQTATENSPFSYTFAANTFSDVDAGDTLTYTATLADGSALPSWLSFDAATRNFSGTPNSGVGSLSVSVIATDLLGASISDTFELNINNAPTLANAIGNQTATEDSPFSYTFAANTFSDVDAGDTLTYTATLADGSALPTWLNFDAANRTFSGNPTNSEVGILSVKVTATDLAGAVVDDMFDIAVANTNDAPIVTTPIAAQTLAAYSLLNFSIPAGSFTDVDAGDVLTYTATLANGSPLPSWLTFNPGTQTFQGIANSEDSSLSIKVTATDTAGTSAFNTFALDIVLPTTTTTNTINGTPLKDSLQGTATNDLINGLDDNDILMGNVGDDTINGQGGNDILRGGIGNDILNGGIGSDQLFGDDGNDILIGGVGIDTLRGGIGNDILDGGAENDLLFGDDGNDTMIGGSGNDNLQGGNGDDLLYGSAGNDFIYGDAGSDTLWGGTGADSMWGGVGSDKFGLQSGQGADTVRDFSLLDDVFVLGSGLSFGSLTLSQSGSNALIKVGTETLATVFGIQSNQLTASHFVV